jgi:hypothetical protein
MPIPCMPLEYARYGLRPGYAIPMPFTPIAPEPLSDGRGRKTDLSRRQNETELMTLPPATAIAAQGDVLGESRRAGRSCW